MLGSAKTHAINPASPVDGYPKRLTGLPIALCGDGGSQPVRHTNMEKLGETAGGHTTSIGNAHLR